LHPCFYTLSAQSSGTPPDLDTSTDGNRGSPDDTGPETPSSGNSKLDKNYLFKHAATAGFFPAQLAIVNCGRRRIRVIIFLWWLWMIYYV